jgi:molecular chaperone GrpE
MSDQRDKEPRGRPPVKVTDRRRVPVDGEGSSVDPSPPPVVPGEGPGSDVAESSPGTGGQEAEVEAARREAAEYREHLQRLQAEFDNYRKRVLKEQTRAVEMASEPFVRRLLEVLDEFELALMAAEKRPDYEKFLRGVELVYAKLMDILHAEGVERIKAEGKPFDPQRHEALMQGGDAEGEAMVSDVLRQGYTMRGRVLRPAGVKVTRR